MFASYFACKLLCLLTTLIIDVSIDLLDYLLDVLDVLLVHPANLANCLFLALMYGAYLNFMLL